MSGDISHVSPETSPTLTDLSTDFASTSAAQPKLYHITEPWDDPSAPTSEPATPRSVPAGNIEHSTPRSVPPGNIEHSTPREAPDQEAKEDVEPAENVTPAFSPVMASPSELEADNPRQEQPSPGAESVQSGHSAQTGSSIDKIIHEASLLVNEMNQKDSVEQIESSNNTTYRDLPVGTAAHAVIAEATPDQGNGDTCTTLADQEVEILNTDRVASKNSSSRKPAAKSDTDEIEMDAGVADKVCSELSPH